jgi:hypothetical protein
LSVSANTVSSYSPHLSQIQQLSGPMQNQDSSVKIKFCDGSIPLQKSRVNWMRCLCCTSVNFWHRLGENE